MDIIDINNYYKNDKWSFELIVLETPLSHSDKKKRKQTSENSQTLLILLDGIVSVSVNDVSSFDETSYLLTEKNCILSLNGEQYYSLHTISAWTAKMLIVSFKTELEDAKNTRSVSQCLYYPVEQCGLWRFVNEEISKVLGLGYINFLTGSKNTNIFGAHYPADTVFRSILIDLSTYENTQFPELGLLPSFKYKGQEPIMFVGIEGMVQIVVNGKPDWITEGKIGIIENGDHVSFYNKSSDKTKFCLLTEDSEKSLIENIEIDDIVKKAIKSSQNTLMSKMSYYLFGFSI